MALACTQHHTHAISIEGSLYTSSTATAGQFARPRDAPATAVRQVAAPAAASDNLALVTDGGELWLRGLGATHAQQQEQAALTRLPPAMLNDESVLMAALGEHHTAVVTQRGALYTFGQGPFAEFEHEVAERIRRSHVPRRLSADLFHGERVAMAAVGAAHTVALTESGRVWIWGDNFRMGLGGDPHAYDAPLLLPHARFGGERVVMVAAAREHTAAVTQAGRLYTWGENSAGQLGHGHYARVVGPTAVDADLSVVTVACGFDHTLAVARDGSLWACGSGLFGKLGLGADLWPRTRLERVGNREYFGGRVVAAAAGYTHSAAVTEYGDVYTWGNNAMGQLGTGVHDSRNAPQQAPVPARCGRCCKPPRAHALAFMLGLHARLGGGGVVAARTWREFAGSLLTGHGGRRVLPRSRVAALSDDMVDMVFQQSVPRWDGVGVGVRRLMGDDRAWRG